MVHFGLFVVAVSSLLSGSYIESVWRSILQQDSVASSLLDSILLLVVCCLHWDSEGSKTKLKDGEDPERARPL